MLIYHPAFDIYHCIFRIVRLLCSLPKEPYETDRIRILDFYLLFPHLLEKVTFPKDASKLRKYFKKLSSKYENIEDPKRIFSRLEPYQTSALKCLVSYNLIVPETFEKNRIQLSETEIPNELIKSVNTANDRFPELIELLTKYFINIDLYGNSGLKQRTDLFEYRYDLA